MINTTGAFKYARPTAKDRDRKGTGADRVGVEHEAPERSMSGDVGGADLICIPRNLFDQAVTATQAEQLKERLTFLGNVPVSHPFPLKLHKNAKFVLVMYLPCSVC